MRGVREDYKVDREMDLQGWPLYFWRSRAGARLAGFCSILENKNSLSLCIVLETRTKNGYSQPMPGAIQRSCSYPFLLSLALVGGCEAATCAQPL